MKIRDQKVLSVWKFDPRSNVGQPPFVSVTSALGGPRAHARPPQTPGEPYPMQFFLAPGDYLVQLEGGVHVHLSEHAGVHLLAEETEPQA